MAKSGFDFKQYEKWANNLHVAQEEFKAFIETFLIEMAQRCIAKTKQRTPVDTGILRNTWAIGEIVVSGNTMYVELYNPMEYSSYVEYGHSQEPRTICS